MTNRIYNNGRLIRYEMDTRGRRMYRRAQIKDMAARGLIVSVATLILTAVLLTQI
jgi:hypothetical protein